MHKATHISHLVVIDNGIDSGIHLSTKLVGILTKRSDILHRVTRSSTCTEPLWSDVHRIRPMVDGSNAAFQILGWCQ